MTTDNVQDVQFGERLLLLRNKKGISRTLAAKEMDMGLSSLQQYEGGIVPGAKNINKIAQYYGCDKGWLLTGQGEPFPGARAKYPDVCGPNVSEFVTVPPQPDFPSDDFVFIRQVNGKISAGNGLAPDNTAEMFCAFRKDWMKKRGGKVGQMSLIKVDGDSMEPTLMSGDLVLVDHSRTSVTGQGGIYAISIDQEILIKRIQVLFPQRKIRILSDNQHYEPIEADPEQVRINGRVIWFGRDMDK